MAQSHVKMAFLEGKAVGRGRPIWHCVQTKNSRLLTGIEVKTESMLLILRGRFLRPDLFAVSAPRKCSLED